jgi:hypothetical protein
MFRRHGNRPLKFPPSTTFVCLADNTVFEIENFDGRQMPKQKNSPEFPIEDNRISRMLRHSNPARVKRDCNSETAWHGSIVTLRQMSV